MDKNVIFFHIFASYNMNNVYGCHNVTALQLNN